MTFIFYIVSFIAGYAAGHYMGWIGGYDRSTVDAIKRTGEYFYCDED